MLSPLFEVAGAANVVMSRPALCFTSGFHIQVAPSYCDYGSPVASERRRLFAIDAHHFGRARPTGGQAVERAGKMVMHGGARGVLVARGDGADDAAVLGDGGGPTIRVFEVVAQLHGQGVVAFVE
ncbi:hypothetical protein D3C86_1570730 [compost metagenome]